MKAFKILLIFTLISLSAFPLEAGTSWTVKPPLGTPIDWSHPLARGLVGVWLMNEDSGKILTNLADPVSPAIMSSSISRTVDGISNRGDNANATIHGTPNLYDIGNYTILLRGRPQGSGVNDRSLIRMQNSNPLVYLGVGTQAGVGGIDNKFYLIERDDGGGGLGGGGGNTNINDDTRVIVYGATKKLSTGLWSFYFDGQPDGTFAGSITSIIHATTPTITLFHSGSSTFRGDHEYMFIWKRCLSDFEVKQHFLNPYAMFKSPDPWYTSAVAAVRRVFTIQ